jgi:hypothetical protein
MSGFDPLARLILHFTHLQHLPQVLHDGELLADSLVGARMTHEVGDRGIKARRRLLPIKCAPGGFPCDYVPFYFGPRSPMLYRIARGGVEHYQDGQDPLVYLVSTVGAVVASGLPWAFSNGNCGSPLTDHFNDLSLLETMVDWPLMRAEMWSDTADDPTRATRRAAEFMVHQRFPIRLVAGFVCRSAETAVDVRRLLRTSGVDIPVDVRAGWYYNGSRYR